MAKVNGPLFSLDAHGDIGNTLRYQRRGHTNYVKRINKLPTTASIAQLAHREKYKQYWDYWDKLGFWTKLIFNVLAAIYGFNSGRHAYLFYRLGWR